ncbi:MAG: serine hydrolase domain-containing protein [Catenibacillus sp.]
MIEKLFKEFTDYATDKNLYIDGIAVADEKKVLLEHYFTPDLIHNIHSHTKSYLSAAIGIAISQGKISLDDRLADYFPEAIPDHASPLINEIRLRHLLTMSSGFDYPYLSMNDRRSGVGAPDYITYMLSRPVQVKPGSHFLYSTADSILAGRMLEKAVGMNLGEYLFHEIFSPLGQGHPIWETDMQGHPIGGGGIFMKLTDMMKLGQVYLAGGRWNGRQLIDPSWVRESTSMQIDSRISQNHENSAQNAPTPQNSPVDLWNCGYGYQFWLSPYPLAYRADGAFGQITTVFPKSNLVVAIQCPEKGDFEKVKLALHEIIFSQLS